ncbi:ArsR/SmtB family transcription factor [Lederbergia lenta]|uniref:Transcriptional regulator, ArsR family n=1 Tax=Lederbergia lenta TaxID=1467 RepID=A0A2X4WJ59_LEDLE|nr:metalloregulator ArsR/SmtB family transcription factor [Lederbergia lenta]MCM3109411.1 metalloregulator ArsR/SmtB family transcription factor [Lederbergia lenta]MEC2324823.1 metalloregulator ArsR/SmtB family transcription factor [Lederbergia lenta]SQI57600.1 transcriptional regulator, ArsR family [Lederbergia lenta]
MNQSVQKYDVFQAIADPTRRKVLQLLAEKELPISAITAQFTMSRTAIAKHLYILSEAKLVSGRKVGREKRYQLQAEPLAELKDWISFYEQFWENKLSNLKHIVEDQKDNGVKLMEKELER